MAGVFEALAAALADREARFGDWSVHGRKRTWAEARAGLVRRGRRDETSASVHVDVPKGRGSAELVLDTPEPIDLLLDDARARALAAVGPGWQSSPPAAPAKVALADPRLGDPEDAALQLLDELTAAAATAGVTLVDALVTVERSERAVSTSRGLASRWAETALAIEATIASGGRTARIGRRLRRRADLGLAAMFADAAQRARDRGGATATPAGVRPVLISAALLGGEGAAILDAVGAIADAGLHRQGLARARVGAPIVDGATSAAEPLSISSDGTLRWGLRSAPLGVHGEPVRRFPILDAGTLVGLGLDEREGALRGTPPNAGVANLVFSEGAADAAALRDAGVLELHELTYVDLEPLTGRASLGIGLATVHGATPQLVSGGELQGDLVAALARSIRSSTHVTAGPYAGPDLLLLPDLRVG